MIRLEGVWQESMRFYTISFGSNPRGSSPFQGVANRRRGFGRSSLLPCASPLWSERQRRKKLVRLQCGTCPLFPKCILFPQICPDLKKKCWEVIWDCRKPPWVFCISRCHILWYMIYCHRTVTLWHLELGKPMALGFYDLPQPFESQVFMSSTAWGAGGLSLSVRWFWWKIQKPLLDSGCPASRCATEKNAVYQYR